MGIRKHGRLLVRRLSVLVIASAIGGAGVASAQTEFVPYFGKNQIRYDKFDWRIYNTDHFEIYYYPEIEPHLEKIAGYAESAYQHVSSELKHDLAFKVPLILFSTASEFWQQNVVPGAAQEGVGAFAEPSRYRIVMPMDEPSDLLYRLTVHELTHQFQYDIIPTSLVRQNMPLWVFEGMSDYMTGVWRPIDLMTVRDAAVADIVPKMSEMQGYGGFGNLRLIYNLGHAAFEFIEARWGKEGVRQFVFSLRKSVIGGGENAFREAFDMDADEWDQQFDRYLKERFKPFRDKERPADYGRDLAPNPLKTRYSSVLSVEPSPSGDVIAAMTGNQRDRELDILLLSTRDGSVVKNLTQGFDQNLGFESIPTPGMRFNNVPWMSWGPNDRLAYFVRTEKDRSLIVQNIVSRKVEMRIPMVTVDSPESPDFSPDGRTIAFAAASGIINDIYTINLETKAITNLTKDEFADYSPTWSPDGRSIVHLKRVSGNEKLFRLDLASGEDKQLTFGTHDEGGAQFIDANTLVFTSTATDPAKPIDPDVAKNGTIPNVWTLDLRTGELQQYTDALAGNFSPVILNPGTDNSRPRVAFVSYYKGEYGLHALDRREPIAKAATADFGAPGPNIDFQAPMTHTLVAENKHKKGKFEKMFLDGRPPVALGVTSGGDFFGGTQISFSDVLGDQQFNLFASSVSQYRTMSLSYLNLERRFQYALQGYSQTSFFYGALEGLFYDQAYAGIIDRDYAVATRTVRGGTAFGIYPFNRYRRVELYGGFQQYREEFDDPSLEYEASQYQQEQFGRTLFNNGNMMPLGVTFIQETTIFREFGPLAGSTARINYEVSPNLGDATLSRQTIDVDARKYYRLAGSGLLALRARGYRSWGENPGFLYFGGNSEMRGYDYLSFIGQESFFLNAELRFPLIEAMATPIGILGGIRGTFFANMGGAAWDHIPFTYWRNETTIETPLLGSQPVQLPNGQLTLEPIYGAPRAVDGFRLVDGRASYGISLQTFALGFPVHFDWSWRTLFNRDWEDVLFARAGGSSEFRKAKFTMWIGYDF
jgi:Tol biopolymer transport system component